MSQPRQEFELRVDLSIRQVEVYEDGRRSWAGAGSDFRVSDSIPLGVKDFRGLMEAMARCHELIQELTNSPVGEP